MGRAITISQLAHARLSSLPMDTGQRSAATRILDAIGLDSGTLALVVDSSYDQLGSAVQRAAEERGLSIAPYVVDDERLARGAFVERLSSALDEVDGTIYFAGPRGISPSLRDRLLAPRGKRRNALLLGIDERVASQSLATPPEEIEEVGERVRGFCRDAGSLEIIGLAGTRLVIRYGSTSLWHHDRATLDGPGLTVLPAGRLFFCPTDVSGSLTPDGGVLLPDEDARLPSMRLRLHFEEGRLVEADGPLADRILKAARSTKNGNRVGQVVLGTNTAVLTPIGHEGQDSTMPGLHLVLGDTRPEHTGASFCASSGITLGLRRPDVRREGEPLLVRGKLARALV